MAKEHSMDISVQFDFQEVRNAVEQSKKEAQNRYDLKDSNVEIELGEKEIKVTAGSEMQIEAIYGILLKKLIARNQSPNILDRQKIQEIGGMRVRQEMKLITVIDSESAREISKKIRELFPKAKPVIQGDTIRVTSPSIDILQEIIQALRADEKLDLPLEFGNYR